jgi:hypothetical protein
VFVALLDSIGSVKKSKLCLNALGGQKTYSKRSSGILPQLKLTGEPVIDRDHVCASVGGDG